MDENSTHPTLELAESRGCLIGRKTVIQATSADNNITFKQFNYGAVQWNSD